MLGAVASGYHGADRSSRLRPLMRKLDYYTICYTSTVLRRAAHISLPRAAKAAAVLVAPFKPSIVTGLNLALVEVRALGDDMMGCAAVGCSCAQQLLVVLVTYQLAGAGGCRWLVACIESQKKSLLMLSDRPQKPWLHRQLLETPPCSPARRHPPSVQPMT